jgi:hypothetical protein
MSEDPDYKLESYLAVRRIISDDHPGAAVFAAGVAGIGYTLGDLETRWDWFRKGWDAKQTAGDGSWLPGEDGK